MSWITDGLKDWATEAFKGGVVQNFQDMFGEINNRVSETAVQIGQTPDNWNSEVYNLIKNISDTVIIPIAGIILTFVVCYELIHMFIEKNNMHDLDSWVFFKWIFKTIIAVYLLTHTFDIVMGIFGIAQWVVNRSAVIIGSSINTDIVMNSLIEQLNGMEWYELLGLFIETFLVKFAMKAVAVCVFIIVYGRMMEIYLTVSIAPIPIATLANREWGQIGNNYLKSIFAVAFQGFLIMVCLAIYAMLLQGISDTGNIHTAVWGYAGYTVLLCYTLFKTSSLSKSIFSSH